MRTRHYGSVDGFGWFQMMESCLRCIKLWAANGLSVGRRASVFSETAVFRGHFSGRPVPDELVRLLANMSKVAPENALGDGEGRREKEEEHGFVGMASRKRRWQPEKSNKKPAAVICLQVLGNGATGSSRAVYVFTDQSRYLFNCGEGTQRLANEYKAKLSKLEHVFVTHASWSNMGGLVGLALTMQGIGVSQLHLHGPDHIQELFEMTRGFALTDGLGIRKCPLADGSHTDHLMNVKYVPLYGLTVYRPETTDDGEITEKIDYYDHWRRRRGAIATDSSDKSQDQKRPKLTSNAFPENNRETAVAYICKPTNKPGRLLLEKCLEHGVPPGPLLGALKDGQDVTLPNGNLVKSSDVVEPDEAGPVFIVLECPSVHFLDSLLESSAFFLHQREGGSAEDMAALVVHFTPMEVVADPRYQQWLQRFPETTDQLFVNERNDGPSSVAVHRIQHKLNLLHANIFPLLKEDIGRERIDDSTVHPPCEPLVKYSLRPFTRMDRTASVSLNPKEYVEECTTLPDFDQALSSLKSKFNLVESLDSSSNLGKKFPEIVFLGTGSSVPSKVRNTSGILLNTSAQSSILLDCGEGTCSQLLRFYGSDDAELILRNIRVVYISHLHADHHIGLIELVKHRRTSFERAGLSFSPVKLLAPQQIMSWLREYHSTFESILDCFRLVPNAHLMHANDDDNYSELLDLLDAVKVESTLVKHCYHAFGLALTHKDGWKLVYSGDTMPCDSLLKIGKGCDVLIHEATMEDELEVEAQLKRHSTTSQAIEQGKKMNAKFIILTHFSQRYAKVPVFTEDFGNRVGIAFDNLRVSFDDLHALPHMVPILKVMFAEDYEEMQEKTAKKLRQRARQMGKVKEV